MNIKLLRTPDARNTNHQPNRETAAIPKRH
jgi:hypothetical protein